MKGCKTVAEYAVRCWMRDNGFVLSCFSVEMDGNRGEITDQTGDSIVVCYDPKNKSVRVEKED